jgi:hypothetical protein
MAGGRESPVHRPCQGGLTTWPPCAEDTPRTERCPRCATGGAHRARGPAVDRAPGHPRSWRARAGPYALAGGDLMSSAGSFAMRPRPHREFSCTRGAAINSNQWRSRVDRDGPSHDLVLPSVTRRGPRRRAENGVPWRTRGFRSPARDARPTQVPDPFPDDGRHDGDARPAGVNFISVGGGEAYLLPNIGAREPSMLADADLGRVPAALVQSASYA